MGQPGEGRVVTYTSTQLAGLPGRFEFHSRIVFTANSYPRRNEAFRVVLSRVDVLELTATNDEVLELMEVMARRGFAGLSPAMCREVVEFIRKAGGSRQLSMRLNEPSMRKVEYALGTETDWRDLVRTQLDQLGFLRRLAAVLGISEGVVRCRVKPVYLTRREVFAVVTEWGRMDAARERPISDADRLPPPVPRRVPVGLPRGETGRRAVSPVPRTLLVR